MMKKNKSLIVGMIAILIICSFLVNLNLISGTEFVPENQAEYWANLNQQNWTQDQISTAIGVLNGKISTANPSQKEWLFKYILNKDNSALDFAKFSEIAKGLTPDVMKELLRYGRLTSWGNYGSLGNFLSAMSDAKSNAAPKKVYTDAEKKQIDEGLKVLSALKASEAESLLSSIPRHGSPIYKEKSETFAKFEKQLDELVKASVKIDPKNGLDFIKEAITMNNPELKENLKKFSLDVTGVNLKNIAYGSGTLFIGNSRLAIDGTLPNNLASISYVKDKGFLYQNLKGARLLQEQGFMERNIGPDGKTIPGDKWVAYYGYTGSQNTAYINLKDDTDTQVTMGTPADDKSGYKYQSGIYIIGPKNGIVATVDVGDAQLQVPIDREWAYMNPLKASLDNTGAYKIYGKVAFTGYSVTTDDFVVIDTESADNRYVSKSGEKIMVVRSQTSETGTTKNTISGNIEGVGSIIADEGVTFHYGKYDDQDSFGIITQDGLTYRVTKDGQFTPRVGSDTESAPAESQTPDVKQITNNPCGAAAATAEACATACGGACESDGEGGYRFPVLGAPLRAGARISGRVAEVVRNVISEGPVRHAVGGVVAGTGRATVQGAAAAFRGAAGGARAVFGVFRRR